MDFTGCVSVSVFSSLIAIPIILGIMSYKEREEKAW